MLKEMTYSELLRTVRGALEACDVSKVWWLKFEVREQERTVELHVSTVPRTRHDHMASGAMTFNRYADKEYIVWGVQLFVKEACGLGSALLEEPKG